MNKNIYALLIVLLLGVGLITTSCKGFLDHRPYSVGEGSGDYWENPENLYGAVDALNRFSSEEGITGRGILWFENCSDNLITGRPQAEAAQIKNFNMSPDNGRDAKENWSTFYGIIGQANAIIKNVKGRDDIDPKLKNYALGNAYFYRALSYLWIAPWYGDNGPNGGIPNITDETPVEEYDSPRPSSVLVNYDQILADLDSAAELLPYFSQQESKDYGRPWKGAAWGLATRAALYASAFDAKYLDKVIEYADKVIGMSGADQRALHADVAKAFTVEETFGSEYLYSIVGSAKLAAGPKFHGISWENKGWGGMNTWGYFQPTLELWNAYDEGDKRRGVTLARLGDEVKFEGNTFVLGAKYIEYDDQGNPKKDDKGNIKKTPKSMSSDSGITFYKWLDPYKEASDRGVNYLPNGNFMSTTLGMIIVRYSDVLLMKAEALIWKNGEGDAEAIRILNAIRQRAGLPQNSQATKEQLKNERRCELAFEFGAPRFLDIMRWKDYHLLEQPLHGYDKDYYYKHDQYKVIEAWPARKFDPAKNCVFPIPASDIAKSKNLKQNIGY